jgi:hypothetical protein
MLHQQTASRRLFGVGSYRSGDFVQAFTNPISSVTHSHGSHHEQRDTDYAAAVNGNGKQQK